MEHTHTHTFDFFVYGYINDIKHIKWAKIAKFDLKDWLQKIWFGGI